MKTLLNTKPVINLRVRWISEHPECEPQGTLTDVGYGAVTIEWDDDHSPSCVPRSRWDDLEVI